MLRFKAKGASSQKSIIARFLRWKARGSVLLAHRTAKNAGLLEESTCDLHKTNQNQLSTQKPQHCPYHTQNSKSNAFLRCKFHRTPLHTF